MQRERVEGVGNEERGGKGGRVEGEIRGKKEGKGSRKGEGKGGEWQPHHPLLRHGIKK